MVQYETKRYTSSGHFEDGPTHEIVATWASGDQRPPVLGIGSTIVLEGDRRWRIVESIFRPAVADNPTDSISYLVRKARP